MKSEWKEEYRTSFEVVYTAIHTPRYRVDVILPDGNGSQKQLEAKCYSTSPRFDAYGHVQFDVMGKETVEEDGAQVVKTVVKRSVGYPHYHLNGSTLCSFKNHGMRIFRDEESVTVAISHNLLGLPWTSCIVVLADEGEFIFFSLDRTEWEQNGDVKEHEEEVQIFLRVPLSRTARVTEMDVIKDFVPGSESWLGDAYNAHAMRG